MPSRIAPQSAEPLHPNINYRVAKTHSMPSWNLFCAKEPPIIGLFCGKRPIQTRHPLGLRHPARPYTLQNERLSPFIRYSDPLVLVHSPEREHAYTKASTLTQERGRARDDAHKGASDMFCFHVSLDFVCYSLSPTHQSSLSFSHSRHIKQSQVSTQGNRS